MTEIAEPSLRIGFDVTRTKAVLRAQSLYKSELAQLAAGFPAGCQRGLLVVELALEDFLVGLDALGTWPSPGDVEWEEALAELVGGVLDDADAAERILHERGWQVTLLPRTRWRRSWGQTGAQTSRLSSGAI